MRVRSFHYLEKATRILVAQVDVDHLQQCPDFVVAHLIIVVLVSATQVSMNPSDTQTVKEAARAEHPQCLVVSQFDQNLEPIFYHANYSACTYFVSVFCLFWTVKSIFCWHFCWDSSGSLQGAYKTTDYHLPIYVIDSYTILNEQEKDIGQVSLSGSYSPPSPAVFGFHGPSVEPPPGSGRGDPGFSGTPWRPPSNTGPRVLSQPSGATSLTGTPHGCTPPPWQRLRIFPGNIWGKGGGKTRRSSENNAKRVNYCVIYWHLNQEDLVSALFPWWKYLRGWTENTGTRQLKRIK